MPVQRGECRLPLDFSYAKPTPQIQCPTALSVYQKTNSRASEAIVLENLARAYQQFGQSEQAIDHWQRAIAYYRQTGDQKQVGRLLTEQAQSYSSLGQLRKAIAILCREYGAEQGCNTKSALQIARAYKDRALEPAALGSLGDAHHLRGEYNQAIEHLHASLKIANEIDNPAIRSSAHDVRLKFFQLIFSAFGSLSR